MYKYGNSSVKKKEQATDILQLILDILITRSVIDITIIETYRSPKRQNKLFLEGKSKIDGINKLGKHNYFPSEAFDLGAYVNGKISWEAKYYYYLAGLIRSISQEIGVEIRWGGNFNMDGDIGEQSFNDIGHWEIIDKRFTKE